jgi:hypothetical protein
MGDVASVVFSGRHDVSILTTGGLMSYGADLIDATRKGGI